MEEIQRLVEAALSYIDSTIFTVLGKVAAQVFPKHIFTGIILFFVFRISCQILFQFIVKKYACLTKVIANIFFLVIY
jgi:hypothetical protein